MNPPAAPLPSDVAIVEGIAAGEDWAADALYARVQPVVDRCLRRILRSTGPDYDDLVQAAFERIIIVLSRKPLGGQCELRAWSAAVTTHVALDSLRRKRLEQRLFQREPDLGSQRPAALSSEARLEARSEVSRLQRVLSHMKPKAAESLVLHDVLGYELSEIAAITGLSAAAAQSRLIRSRKEFIRRANAKGLL